MTTFQVGKISAKQTESVKKGDMMLPKGCQKRIIMVNRPGSRYFESVYFVLKSGLPRSVSERDMLREAELLVSGADENCRKAEMTDINVPSRTVKRFPSLTAWLTGAAVIGAVAGAISLIAALML